jgi:ornithine cyclodeaminase/alanine dehydrogenase-like protein (mu-crystallin family)
MGEPELRVLDRDAVERCVAAFDPLDVVESALRSHATGNTVLPAEAYMEWNNPAGAHCRSIAMPGGVPGRDGPVYGVKIINAAVSNPSAGLDRAGGVTMLFDPCTARPYLMADAGYLSALRTAAYTLLSLRHLGPQECESISLIGCGALAREHLRLFARYYPSITTAYVYDLDQGRSRALADWAGLGTTGITVVSCNSAPEAAAASTVVITVTTSRKPYIERDWLRPACFVAHVSLDDLAENVFLAAEAVFVDDVSLVRDNPRRILGRLMAEDKIDKIDGTLGEVLMGTRQAIRPHNGVVVSNPFGMSILDIALLEQVARTAEERGLGSLLRVFGLGVDRWPPENAGFSRCPN